MREMLKMKKRILKNENPKNSYEKWMKNEEEMERLMQDLRDEIYFYRHGLNKIYDITNTYYIGNRYHVEMRTHASRNQREELHRFLLKKIYQYPDLLRFLEENAKSEKPLTIQIRMTKKSFEPIVYVNKKSYSLMDFAVLVQNGKPKDL